MKLKLFTSAVIAVAMNGQNLTSAVKVKQVAETTDATLLYDIPTAFTQLCT